MESVVAAPSQCFRQAEGRVRAADGATGKV